MTPPSRLLINGANGRMGQALQRLCAEPDSNCQVVAAVARKVGQRVIEGVPQFAASELGGAPEFDAAVDFSLPDGFDRVLALCLERGRPLVSGTTGLSEAQRASLAAAAARIPVLWSSNFSLGVAVLTVLAERAAAGLPGWDCDIVESHHAGKRDAPSGTALVLGDAVAAGGGQARYASIRAGDIVGEHIVQFTSAGERIELVHRATNRHIFARGALQAARKIVGRGAGLYGMRDLVD